MDIKVFIGIEILSFVLSFILTVKASEPEETLKEFIAHLILIFLLSTLTNIGMHLIVS